MFICSICFKAYYLGLAVVKEHFVEGTRFKVSCSVAVDFMREKDEGHPVGKSLLRVSEDGSLARGGEWDR